MRVARNVDWDVDIEDAVGAVMDMSIVDASSFLELDEKRYREMDYYELLDYAYDVFEKSESLKAEACELPESVEIPDDVENDEIDDWLSDMYGFCHRGYILEE